MDRLKKIWRNVGGIVIILSAVLLVTFLNRKDSSGGTPRRTVFAFTAMNTVFTFTFDGDERTVESAVREAKKQILRIEKTCSYFDPESELSHMNASAADQPFPCSEELWYILQECRRIHRLSGGAFDPMVRPLMRLWGFQMKQNRIPTVQEIAEAEKLCGFGRIRFDEEKRTVFFPVRGMSVDLGGIAKGRAADLAVFAAERAGVLSGMINAGGNIRVLSRTWDGKENYRIGIRDPQNADWICAYALLSGNAVSTSGSYERYSVIEGKKYSHIMDPRTGTPIPPGMLSVSVTAPDAMTADALSTALFVCGEKDAAALREKIPGMEYLIVTASPDGKVSLRYSPGWKRQ